VNMFRVWYSTRAFAEYIIDHTHLRQERDNGNLELSQIYESDASRPREFHTVPTHIKNILYLDSPDIIVEKNTEPVFSVEVSTEAGTGHNVFQRFARIAASVENNVPAFYIYPEAVFIMRRGTAGRWDRLNPLIFEAFEKVMRLYGIPALMYYFPSEYGRVDTPTQPGKGVILSSEPQYMGCPDPADPEMQALFQHINLVVQHVKENRPLATLINNRSLQRRRDWMTREFHQKGGHEGVWSPMSSTEIIPTGVFLEYLRRYAGGGYEFTEFLPSRQETLLYKVNARFRGDPYPGALAAIDYIACREGKTYEERDKNLAMVWGEMRLENGRLEITGDAGRSVDRFVESVQRVYQDPNRLLLGKAYSELRGEEIPRYFMQVRFGSTFTKVKHVRVYSYFCDALLFPDGALWREG